MPRELLGHLRAVGGLRLDAPRRESFSARRRGGGEVQSGWGEGKGSGVREKKKKKTKRASVCFLGGGGKGKIKKSRGVVGLVG